jgi:hypothetical protein
MVQSMLGLVPAGFEKKLKVRRPLLPEFVDRLEAREIRVAGGEASLQFLRREGVRAEVRVLEVRDLQVEIED